MRKNIFGIAELLLAVILTAGSVTFFRACDSPEGHYMACHWAQNTVTLLGIILTVSALLRILIPDRGIKAGIAAVMLLTAIGTALIPGRVIDLCMMNTMRCHTVFKPAVTALSVLLAVTAAADAAAGITGKVRADEHIASPIKPCRKGAGKNKKYQGVKAQMGCRPSSFYNAEIFYTNS